MILKPDYNVKSLYNIPFDELKHIGVKALMFDLDSTVMPSKSGEFPNDVVSLFNKLAPDFILSIISNNKNKNYIDQV